MRYTRYQRERSNSEYLQKELNRPQILQLIDSAPERTPVRKPEKPEPEAKPVIKQLPRASPSPQASAHHPKLHNTSRSQLQRVKSLQKEISTAQPYQDSILQDRRPKRHSESVTQIILKTNFSSKNLYRMKSDRSLPYTQSGEITCVASRQQH